MEFRELTNILTIAEEGSLSKAAEKLFVSQSSLSQFLKSYEASIGCSLFVRTSTGMRPTEAGERVLEAAHQIVAIGNNLQNELWDIANLSTGKVSLGLTPFRGSFVLPDILPAFYARYPQITIHTVEANTQTLEDHLLRGIIDVALLTYPLINKKLPTEDAYEEEVYLAVNKDSHVLELAKYDTETGRTYVDFEDVMHEPFILLSKGQRLFTLAESQFDQYGCKPHVIQKTQNPETSIRLAEQGLGLAFMAGSYIHPIYNGSYKLSYLSIGREGLHRKLVFAFPPNTYRSKATMAFVEMASRLLAPGGKFS